MGDKTCRKCGHTTIYGGMEPQSCIECGAVYHKVEEALRVAEEAAAKVQAQVVAREQAQAEARDEAEARAQVAQSNSQFAASVLDAGGDVHMFARYMRDDSLYPVWRDLVGVVTVLGYFLAVAMLVPAVIAIYNGSVVPGLVGIAVAVVVAVVARVGKEVSLMLADLSDASVRLAARASSGEGGGA